MSKITMVGTASSDGDRRRYQSRNETQRVNDNSSSTNDNLFYYPLVAAGCFMLLGGLILIGVVLLATIFPPGNPCFRIELISQDMGASMTISSNSTSDIHNYVSADLNLTLSFTNKDQQLKRMEPLLAAIKYGDEVLYSTKMDPFYAISQERKTFQLDISIRASNLKDATIYSMAKDLGINQAVEFILIIQGRCWINVSHPRNSDYGVDTTIPVTVSASSIHLQLTSQSKA